jgi:DNA-binding transcriptional ArsR family regulator
MVDRKSAGGTGRASARGPATGAEAPVAPPDPGPATQGDRPVRARAIGGEELKAFTHPLRMAMYSALRDYGPATATQLARRLGESSGQTSYHLRQLERHGFVEDDPEHTGGRERWWRPRSFSVADPVMIADPAQAPAVRAMFDLVIADRVRVLRQFFEAVMSEVADDDESAGTDTTTTLMTRAEAKAMIDEVQLLINEHTDRAKARAATDDLEERRRMRVFFDVVPLIDESTGEPIGPVVGRAAPAMHGAAARLPAAEEPQPNRTATPAVADEPSPEGRVAPELTADADAVATAPQAAVAAEAAPDGAAVPAADDQAASGHRVPDPRGRGGR